MYKFDSLRTISKIAFSCIFISNHQKAVLVQHNINHDVVADRDQSCQGTTAAKSKAEEFNSGYMIYKEGGLYPPLIKCVVKYKVRSTCLYRHKSLLIQNMELIPQYS